MICICIEHKLELRFSYPWDDVIALKLLIPQYIGIFYVILTYCFSQTLYTYPENWRAFKAQIAAQYSGARLKVASSPPAFTFGQTNRSPAFLSNFPLGKVGTCSVLGPVECYLTATEIVSCLTYFVCILFSLGSSLPG